MMMKESIDKIFLEINMENLGDAFSFVSVNHQLSLDVFITQLFFSRVLDEIEAKNPKYTTGITGNELAITILNELGINTSDDYNDYKSVDLVAYWTGSMLAYFQYVTQIPYSTILSLIKMNEISSLYYPLHEASEDKFVDVLLRIIGERKQISRLQARRKAMGLSQSELANYSGVNLRTLQDYEIKRKNINNASISILLKLSNALKCNVTDIIELEISWHLFNKN